MPIFVRFEQREQNVFSKTLHVGGRKKSQAGIQLTDYSSFYMSEYQKKFRKKNEIFYALL